MLHAYMWRDVASIGVPRPHYLIAIMNITKILAVLTTFATLACTTAHATPVNLVVNGDFEFTSNGVGQIDARTKATGWTSKGYNFLFAAGTADTTGTYGGLTLWGPANGSKNGLKDSPTGGNFLAADGAYGVAPIYQTITGMTVGQQYILNFDWAGAQQNGFSGANSEQWIVSLGKQTISTATYNNTNHGFSGWMHETFTFTATSSTDVLSFLAHGTPTGVPPFSLLDGVSLTAAVPEPSTTALMFAGFLLLGPGARFRRRDGAGKQ